MANVSTNQVTRKPDTQIDPNNFLPPGVLGMEYKPLQTPNDNAVSSVEIISPSDTVGESVDYSEMFIVSQTLRAGPGGQWVVDVVLGVPDKKGVTTWDVRLAKQ
jgi:hypothetical protein